MYDHIVSLGYNCEVSFRIEDYLNAKEKKLESFLFTWVYVLEREKMIRSILYPENILEGKYTFLPWGMLVDEYSKCSFHLRNGHDIDLLEEPEKTVRLDAAVAELKDRVKHLILKQENLFFSDESTLFVMKVRHETDEKDYLFIKSLAETLSEKYKSGAYDLICIFEGGYNGRREFDNHVHIESVKKFADDSETKQGGDIEGWIDILLKYDACK